MKRYASFPRITSATAMAPQGILYIESMGSVIPGVGVGAAYLHERVKSSMGLRNPFVFTRGIPLMESKTEETAQA